MEIKLIAYIKDESNVIKRVYLGNPFLQGFSNDRPEAIEIEYDGFESVTLDKKTKKIILK